jgi:hypothetical protein
MGKLYITVQQHHPVSFMLKMASARYAEMELQQITWLSPES